MDFGREYLRPLIPKLKRAKPGESSGVAAASPPAKNSNASQPAGESAYFSREHCGHTSTPISFAPSPSRAQGSHEIARPSLYSINIDGPTDDGSSPGSSPGYHDAKASTYESETIPPALSRDSSENFTEEQRQTMDRMEQTYAPEAWETVLRQSEHKRQLRQTAKQMSSKEQDTLPTSVCWPFNFLSTLYGMLCKRVSAAHADVRDNPSLVMLAFKNGLAVAITAVLCVIPEPYEGFSVAALWAVVTVDSVFETTVGMSLSKGLNRAIGTVAAGIIAVGFNHLGPLLGPAHPYFVVLLCFFGGAIPTFYKFRPPFQDRWNYAVVMAALTFHILILTGFRDDETELLWVPLSRFAMIVLAFLVVMFVSLAIAPTYAGDSLHSLVVKNLGTAADMLENCVFEYLKGTYLDNSTELWAKGSAGEGGAGAECGVSIETLPELYEQVVQSDAEVTKLLNTVPFEPCHGAFFRGYPWSRYEDISDNLRYAVYDIIGLDGCLRAEIQAPSHLRQLFRDEMACIGTQCASILRAMSEGMGSHRCTDVSTSLRKAEEAALLLQHRVCKHFPQILHPQEPEMGGSSSEGGAGGAGGVPNSDNLGSGHSRSSLGSTPPHRLTSLPEGRYPPPTEGRVGADGGEGAGEQRGVPPGSPSSKPSWEVPPTKNISPSTSPSKGGGGMQTWRQGEGWRSESLSSHPTWVEGGGWRVEGGGWEVTGVGEGGRDVSEDGMCGVSFGSLGELGRGVMTDWIRMYDCRDVSARNQRVNSMTRQSSIKAQWVGTVERISSLSLVRVVSLLLEIVAKMKYVVKAMEDLAEEAHFGPAEEKEAV